MSDAIPSWLQLPAAVAPRTRYYNSISPSIVESVRLGLLFVMADWSMPARHAFAVLMKVLAKYDNDGELELIVTSSDEDTGVHAIPEFRGQLTGSGEVAWIANGRIIATSGLGYRPECYAPNTARLLASRFSTEL